MTMIYNAYSRWMTHCMTSVGYKDFNPLDILILHNINHRSKEKRLADIAFMLNIEDTHTVNYAVKKLVKAELLLVKRPGKRSSTAPPKRASGFVRNMAKYEMLACWRQPQRQAGILTKSAMSQKFSGTFPAYTIKPLEQPHHCR